MKIRSAKDLKKTYISFFEKKGHREIPSASLIPEGDSSTLFISAGMHPLVPYLMGQKHPLGKRLVDVQECVRTSDIDEVGDKTHHTWFEMLGNWSLGDYFKKESLEWSLEFLVKVLKLDKDRISVTCFAGDETAPKDTQSAEIWQDLGIPTSRIFFLGKKENWWGPVSETGPCGPDSEIFYDTGKKACGKTCNPSCSCGKYTEIWNNVFMEYEKKSDGTFVALKQKNVDTGMGVERTLAMILGNSDHYLSSTWRPIINKIEELSGICYQAESKKPMRIIADHTMAALFIAADGVVPGNKEAGYILRRLIRRSIRQAKLIGIEGPFIVEVAKKIIENKGSFAGNYPELDRTKEIVDVFSEEEVKFFRSLGKGLAKLTEIFSELKEAKKTSLSGKSAFYIFETFGFPFELIKEEAEKEGLNVSLKEFEEKQKEHQDMSRKASAGRFKGGMSGRSPKEIAYHTATHLLHRCLINVLGDHIAQAGSAITPEKMRFDFTYSKPLTDNELDRVEKMVNKEIKNDLPVRMEVMSFADSQKIGAKAFFSDRYPEKVNVYFIGNFSSEVCGGPHVKSTGQLGKFKIIKQESSGSGKRRIYAKLDTE
jgi:alanyl-tRNA synthetase